MIKNVISTIVYGTGAFVFGIGAFFIYNMIEYNNMQYNHSKEAIQYIQQHRNDNEYIFKNFNAIKQYTETKKNTKYKRLFGHHYGRKIPI